MVLVTKNAAPVRKGRLLEAGEVAALL